MVDFIAEHSRLDAEGKAGGVLFSESLLRFTEQRLRSLAGERRLTTPGFESLSSIGITLDNEGRFQVDRATLESKLDNDFDSVAELFGIAPNGVVSQPGITQSIEAFLDDLTTGPRALLDAREDGLQAVVELYDERIERAERRLERHEEFLRAQFTAMEQLVGALQGQAQFLNSLVIP